MESRRIGSRGFLSLVRYKKGNKGWKEEKKKDRGGKPGHPPKWYIVSSVPCTFLESRKPALKQCRHKFVVFVSSALCSHSTPSSLNIKRLTEQEQLCRSIEKGEKERRLHCSLLGRCLNYNFMPWEEFLTSNFLNYNSVSNICLPRNLSLWERSCIAWTILDARYLKRSSIYGGALR